MFRAGLCSTPISPCRVLLTLILPGAVLGWSPRLITAADVVERKVVWFDATNGVRFAYAGAIEETASVLDRAGLKCTFRLGGPEPQIDPDELLIILLSHPHRGVPGKLIMGSVRARPGSRGQIQAVRVYVKSVLAALTLRSVDEDRARVSRAIGRVIAHEVIHVARPGLGHSKRGLMAAVLSASELDAPHVAIDSAFTDALRAPTHGGAVDVEAASRNGDGRKEF